MMRMFLTTLMIVLAAMPPASAEETVHVQFDTTAGPILLELYPERAPVSVRNFLAYVDGGHYNGASFYRTVTFENDNGRPWIEVIQGGLDDAEGIMPPIEHESTADTGLTHENGTISMARGAVGTASSEFFICIGPQPALDHGADRNPDKQGFAAFGRVIRGLQTVRSIHQMEADGAAPSEYVSGQILTTPVEITAARRIAFEGA